MTISSVKVEELAMPEPTIPVGREVAMDEVAQYGFKDGQCGDCDRGYVKVAMGRKSSLVNGKVHEELVWQLRLCVLAHDRFLRKMDKRIAALPTGRVCWRLGLEPENYWFTMFHMADMLDYEERQAFDAKYVDKSVYPWVLRANVP